MKKVNKKIGKEARKSMKPYTKEVVAEKWLKLLEKKVNR